MNSFAKLVLIVLALILVNVYRVYGAEGVKLWFGAKFLNKNYDRPAPRPAHRTVRRAGTRTAGELAWRGVR